MDSSIYTYLFPLIAYLIGTIPTGLVVGKAKGIDIRQHGSGNIGATNVARVVGKKWGIITLVADMLKGLLPVLATTFFLKSVPGADMVTALSGIGAVCGHCFSVFLKFKGGKGVATAVGVFLGTSPLAVLCALVVFYACMKKWGIVSVASLLSAAIMPVFIHLISPSLPIELMAWTIAAVIWFKHSDNIKRLLAGEERKFSASSRSH